MSVSKDKLLDLFYECKTYHRLNSGNESVDIEELISLLEEGER